MAAAGEDDASKQDLFHLIKRFGAYVTFKISDLFSLSFHNLVFIYSPSLSLYSLPCFNLNFTFFFPKKNKKILLSFHWIWYDEKI